MHLSQGILNLPNLLSAYRIAAIPFLLWTIYSGSKTAFVILILVNFATDILDGWIARRWHCETELGAWLDSYADIGTYLTAILGLIVFQIDAVREHYVGFIILLVAYLTPQIFSLVRFKRPTTMHLYSSKATGYIQGIFFFIVFLFGFSPLYFYLMITVSCLNNLEELIMLILLPELKSNARGLYWLLKERKQNG